MLPNSDPAVQAVRGAFVAAAAAILAGLILLSGAGADTLWGILRGLLGVGLICTALFCAARVWRSI
jgi:hypothetical protein